MSKRKTPKTARAKSRKKVRKLSPNARNIIGYPTQRKFPTTKSKRGITPTSGKSYRTSVVWVGLSADLLTDRKIEEIVKKCADRVRSHVYKLGRVSANLVTMFAKLRPVIEREIDGLIVVEEVEGYEEDDFPDVGSSWEFRTVYQTPIRRTLWSLRDDLRDKLREAREASQDSNFVFVDSVEIFKWKW